MILILGAPRTGTTLLYQLICNLWRVNYFANDGQIRNTDAGPVPLESAYGKTKEPHEPSEASYILSKWFGEERAVKPEYKAEMMDTLNIHRPMVIKNIWNVYRVREWLEYFPDVQFVWMRRDTHAAAASDLLSRQATGKGLNGAFLRFGADLFGLSAGDQVIRQQDEINKTIGEALREKDYIQVLYNSLCFNTEKEVGRLRKFLCAEWRGREIPGLKK